MVWLRLMTMFGAPMTSRLITKELGDSSMNRWFNKVSLTIKMIRPFTPLVNPVISAEVALDVFIT